MKASTTLKKIGLYKPAVLVADLMAKKLLKAKFRLYKSRLKRHREKASASLGPKVLIVMNAGGLGNVVEATPLVQAIRIFWPKSIITILSLPGDLLSDWCIPDETIFEMDQLEGRVFDHTFCPYWCWDQQNRLKTICDHGQVHRVKIAHNKYFLKPERQYSLDLIRHLGFRGDAPLYVSIKEPNLELPKSDMRICFVPGGKPGGMWRYKKWPYYDQLASMLQEHFENLQILIIGTEEDVIPDALISNPSIIDLRSKLTLAETAWVLKSADIAVGNDCGPMHIADAVQTRSAVIFGPTCELKNGPMYKSVSISSDADCRPCQFEEEFQQCNDPLCITQITPQIVFQQLLTLLGQ